MTLCQFGAILMLKKILEFGHLVRFSHTLFAMPFALGAMWVAADGFANYSVSEIIRLVVLIVGCMVFARNGAMTFNRLADEKYDKANPRTANRHLPAKKLNRQSVILFLVLNGICFTIFAFLLNPLAGACAVPVFLALLFYSYWKRFSFLCHWYLGFAIGMSPLGAWIAVRGEFAIFPIFLMFILMLWMGGFDIIYATQDEAIDKELGLHSVPARFGRKKALQIALGSHIAMLALALFFGLYWQMGIAWWVVFSLMSLAILYIHLFRKSDDLDSLNRDFFLANVGVSVLVMLGLIFWVIFGGSALG